MRHSSEDFDNSIMEENLENQPAVDEDEELFELHRIEVDPGQEPLRVDKFLSQRISVSRNRIQAATKSGNILVAEKAIKSNYRVRPGDVISIVLPKAREIPELAAENIPLEIIYEDEFLIIVNKKAGMVVHPSPGHYSGTLVNALLYHVSNLPVKGEQSRPGLVHRLDKDTSGLMVIAKTELAMTHLARQFYERSIQRNYVALVWDDIEEKTGTINANIGRHRRHRKLMDTFPEGDYGKRAVTHFEVLERLGYVTLVKFKLETGRTHQIRVHSKHIGHPVFNDQTYGGDRILKGTIYSKYKQFVMNCFKILPRQALHAKTLGFKHPKTEKVLFFESELPTAFSKLVNSWRKYIGFRKG